MGKTRKTVHQYPKNAIGEMGQARNKIIAEITSLGGAEPYTTAEIRSYIAEMIEHNGQTDLIKQYGLEGFEVQVMNKERTLCEKIMSLVRFSFTDTPIQDLNNKIRHIYDIHQLLKEEATKAFFISPSFDELLLKVATDDMESFKNNNDWLQHHPIEAMIFKDVNDTWAKLSNTYLNTFKILLFGELPTEKEITNTLSLVAERLRLIKWTLKINDIKSETSINEMKETLMALSSKELSELLIHLNNKD